MNARKTFTTLLLATMVCTAAQAATKTATLTVTATTKYQYIDGFGGTGMNGQWYDIYTQQKVNLLWGTGDGQVGLNIMRIRVSPNESEWGQYGNAVKWARLVNPNMQVFATPWTPPKKYKTQNTSKYQNEFGTWVWPLYEHPWGGQGSNGGAINPDCYDDYADFLERYRQTMEKKGSPIDIISVQNESDYTPTTTDDSGEHASYESCIYSPKEMAAMCKALRQKLDSKCKVMGPECFGYGQERYNQTLMNLKDAQDYIDIWGNHLYGSYNWDYIKQVTDKTKKHMWMTEYYVNYGDFKNYSGQFAAEYAMVDNLEKSMKAGYNGYVYYNMLDDFFAVSHGGSDTQLWKRAYVFSHYAKYATGKTRIAAALSNTSDVVRAGSSYISQTGDTIVVMLLNTSTANIYNVTVKLPFVPQRILQVATNDAVNALRVDVTEKYANDTKNPVVSLQPGTFYTFQFEKNAASDDTSEPAASAKQPAWGNPLSANLFMADPTSIEHDGRLYVYATDDQQEYVYNVGMEKNSYAHITQLRCLSTNDMVNWTDHGIIDVKAAAPWISTSWAPSIASRQEADGQTHFYLYFTNSATGIGVLTATSPTGPWTDPLGHALIDKNTAGLGTISQIIDPGVCMNADGTEAYLTFGGGDVVGTDLMPGNARIVKLGSDMTSLGSDIKVIEAPCHFEANELNLIGTKWVFSYCTRWNTVSDSEWADYSKTAQPTAASIAYMTASDPMDGSWKYQGVLLPNPVELGYPYGTNHSHLQKFGTKYYLLYHTQWLEEQMGISAGYRNLQINPVTINQRTYVITRLTAQTANIEGVSQLSGVRVNPYEEQDGAMSAITTANWWLVRGVNFAAQGAPARSLILKVRGTGTLDVRTASLKAEPLATATFTAAADEVQTVIVPLTAEQATAVDYLYFVYTHSQGAKVLSWQFSSLTPEEVTGIEELSTGSTGSSCGTVYNLRGQQVAAPTKGLYIINQKKVVVR